MSISPQRKQLIKKVNNEFWKVIRTLGYINDAHGEYPRDFNGISRIHISYHQRLHSTPDGCPALSYYSKEYQCDIILVRAELSENIPQIHNLIQYLKDWNGLTQYENDKELLAVCYRELGEVSI